MKEIRELNRLFLEAVEKRLCEDSLRLGREGFPEGWERFPVALQKEIDSVRAAFNESIPNDFGYSLFLGKGEAELILQYENGSMTSASRGHVWKDNISIYDQLRELDWDEQRKWAIQGTEAFDAIAAVAKELPEMMPATRALQNHVGEQVNRYIEEKRRDPSRVYALLWDGEENLLDNDFDDLKALERDLPDIMTCMLHVLTIVSDGQPVPAEKIDALKKAALKELEDMPISHAKASGKFAYIMEHNQREGQR